MTSTIPATLAGQLAADKTTRRRAKELIARVDDDQASTYDREVAAWQCVGLLEHLVRETERTGGQQ